MDKDVAFCRKIMESRGPTYLTATRLFPKKMREATFVLYAFFRIPDDWVDENGGENATVKIEKWEKKFYETLDGKKNENPVLRATAKVFNDYGIPKSYATDFLRAMKSDAVKSRFENYKALKKYMWGSAGVVGVMMVHLVMEKSEITPEIKARAVDLAEAMQLTNFLRDVKEDWQDRGRIYIPQDELKQFGIDESWFVQEKNDEKWKDMMAWQINRVEKLYSQSWKGIKALPVGGRGAVGASAALYSAYSKKIEKAGNNYWQRDFSLSKAEKFFLGIWGFVRGVCKI